MIFLYYIYSTGTHFSEVNKLGKYVQFKKKNSLYNFSFADLFSFMHLGKIEKRMIKPVQS